MSQLHVRLVQADLHWENPLANMKKFEKIIGSELPHTDLIVLPEMFTTGFSMSPKRITESEIRQGIQWMQDMAKKHHSVITGSLITEEDCKYYNRLFWVRPDGSYATYDKRHLFSLAGEEKQYSAGNKRLVVELNGFKVMPLICYDLRFPVWSRNNLGYDVLIYVANWPERRAYYWDQLLVARAIENQSFVIGVNRVGVDGNGVFHSGGSVCLDPLGNKMAFASPKMESVIDVVLSKDELQKIRHKYRFLSDQDEFEIKGVDY